MYGFQTILLVPMPKSSLSLLNKYAILKNLLHTTNTILYLYLESVIILSLA